MRPCLATLAAVSLLAGCQRNSSPPPVVTGCTGLAPSASGPGDLSRIFPLTPGDLRVRRATSGTGALTYREHVLRGEARDGATVFPVAFTTIDPPGSAGGAYYANGPSGLEVHAAPGYAGDRAGGYPYLALRWPLVPGDHFRTLSCEQVGAGRDLDGDLREDLVTFDAEVTVNGIEKLALGIGVFDAWKVTTVEHQRFVYTSGHPAREATVQVTDWYAPGVGRVRTELAQGSPPVVVQEETLVGWTLAGGARHGLQDFVTLRTSMKLDGGAVARVPGRTIVVWTETPDATQSPAVSRIMAATLPDDGPPGAPRLVAGGFSSWYLGVPSIAASGDRVLVTAYSERGVLGWRLDQDGVRLDPEAGIPLGGSEAPRPLGGDGGWVLATHGAGIQLRRLSRDGVLGDVVAVPGTEFVPGSGGNFYSWAAAWTGDSYLLAWDADWYSWGALRASADGVPLDPEPVTIKKAGDGLALAAASGGALLVSTAGMTRLATDLHPLDPLPVKLGGTVAPGLVATDGVSWMGAWSTAKAGSSPEAPMELAARVGTLPLAGDPPTLGDGGLVAGLDFAPWGYPLLVAGLCASPGGDASLSYRTTYATHDVSTTTTTLHVARVAF